MYTGHFAVALVGGAAGRRIALWLLIIAAFAADITEGVFAAFGVRDPTRMWSHSLPATAAAGVLLALGWRLARGRWRDAAIVFLVTVSHTALDLVTAVKAWWPGATPVGLRLYARPHLDVAIEGAMLVVAWIVWRAALPPARRTQPAVWAMLAVLAVIQLSALLYFEYGPGADASALSKFVR